MNLLSVVDVVLLTVVLLWSGDALRQLHPFHHPVRCIAFGLFAIGAFGCITQDLQGGALHWWTLSLHAGGATYALVKIVANKPQESGRNEFPRQSPGRPV